MPQKEVKLINIHLTQIGKILGNTKFMHNDLLSLEAYLIRALKIVQTTLQKFRDEEMN
jgi:hypothetical protein